MQTEIVTDVMQSALFLVLKTAAPMLLISLVIGLVVSIFQTVTSIQEQTLTFVPKILGVFVTLLICGSWMLNSMSSFIERLWSNFSYYLSLG